MSAPPYMKLFWGDYHKATRHLSRSQHGAYFLLIGEAWRLGGHLPDDDALLARWALCTDKEWADMRAVVMAFFSLSRGKFLHKRVREELAHYEDVSRKRKRAGKSGGKTTERKETENTEAIATQLPTQPEPEPEPEPVEEATASSLSAASRRDRARKIEIPESYPDAEALERAGKTIAYAGAKLAAQTLAERFRNHARSEGRTSANWGAAWDNWVAVEIDKAPKVAAAAAAAAVAWTGPDKLRSTIEDAQGAPWFTSYAARCRWRDLPTPTLIAPNDFVSEKLGAIREILAEFGAHIVVEQAA